jgi:hypothetical protein
MNPEITPEQAIMTIDNAVAQIHGTREQHIVLQQSIEVIKDMIAAYRVLSKKVKTEKSSDSKDKT